MSVAPDRISGAYTIPFDVLRMSSRVETMGMSPMWDSNAKLSILEAARISQKPFFIVDTSGSVVPGTNINKTTRC